MENVNSEIFYRNVLIEKFHQTISRKVIIKKVSKSNCGYNVGDFFLVREISFNELFLGIDEINSRSETYITAIQSLVDKYYLIKTFEDNIFSDNSACILKDDCEIIG